MPESLVKASMIHLFGRVVEDLQINSARGAGAASKRAAKSAAFEQPGAGHALLNQLAAEGSCLARIYGFAFEGGYYELARASLLLVHGEGAPIGDPATVERIGSAATSRTFASDIHVWAYEKTDISLRLDVETGSLEQILLEAEVDASKLKMHFAGQKVRLRGDGGGSD